MSPKSTTPEDFVTNRNTRLSEIMTPVKNLVTVKEGIDLLKANNILQTSKKVKRGAPEVSEGTLSAPFPFFCFYSLKPPLYKWGFNIR
jgi:hypothetical protein